MNDKLEISCPKCDKDNTVNLSTQLSCKHCGEVLTEKKYIKKPRFNISLTKSFFTGILIGITSIFIIYFVFKTDRYSAREEYLILSDCSKNNRSLYGRTEKDRETICIDAYYQTLEDEREIGEKLYTDKSQIFKKLFDKNVEKLSK